jgi:hypothetical protein
VDDCPGALGRHNRVTPALRQNASEREMDALERSEHSCLQRRRRIPKRFYHFFGALVTLTTLADAAMNNLLQVIAAWQSPHIVGPDALRRITPDQHPDKLSHLIHVVACLPLGDCPRQDVAWRRHRVHGVRGDAAAIALLANDAEVAKLEPRTVADEDIHRREIAMQQLTAVQFAEDVENACDFTPHCTFRPPLFLPVQVRTEVAMRRVLEHEIVNDSTIRAHVRKHVKHTDRARVIVEQLAEIRFAQPAVDSRAHFQADGLRNDG